jgi:hypothetical protein
MEAAGEGGQKLSKAYVFVFILFRCVSFLTSLPLPLIFSCTSQLKKMEKKGKKAAAKVRYDAMRCRGRSIGSELISFLVALRCVPFLTPLFL